MKTLVSLALIAAAALFFWNSQHGGGGTLADLQARLDASEQSYRQAGRAAGVSGADTSADAEHARGEVEQVERELQELGRSAAPEDKEEIERLLTRAADLKRKMG